VPGSCPSTPQYSPDRGHTLVTSAPAGGYKRLYELVFVDRWARFAGIRVQSFD